MKIKNKKMKKNKTNKTNKTNKRVLHYKLGFLKIMCLSTQQAGLNFSSLQRAHNSKCFFFANFANQRVMKVDCIKQGIE